MSGYTKLNTNMSSTLVLAPDFSPVSYLPLSTVCWQTAIKLIFINKVSVIEWYDDWVIHSAKLNIRVPAVIVANRGYKRNSFGMRFSRENLYLRDLYSCQYCDETISGKELTIDHVIPVSQGGKTTWENSVTCCRSCNTAKGNKLWKPRRRPEAPDYWRLVNRIQNVHMHIAHASWQQYLGVKNVTVSRRSA
jgi:5-methylcytosine-specific restriction endonuclease McrA